MPPRDLPKQTKGGGWHQRWRLQLRDAESGRNSLPQTGAHHLGIHYKLIGPENIQVILYTYTHSITVNGGHEFEREQGAGYGRVGREEREGEML